MWPLLRANISFDLDRTNEMFSRVYGAEDRAQDSKTKPSLTCRSSIRRPAEGSSSIGSARKSPVYRSVMGYGHFLSLFQDNPASKAMPHQTEAIIASSRQGKQRPTLRNRANILTLLSGLSQSLKLGVLRHNHQSVPENPVSTGLQLISEHTRPKPTENIKTRCPQRALTQQS